jgi:two-component system, OmpR family, phosphate regulon sensor histidine kinase PhoR
VKGSVFLKLIGIALLLIVVTTLIVDFGVRGAWQLSLRAEIEASLSQKVQMVAATIPAIEGCGFAEGRSAALRPLAEAQAQAAQARITIIDACGNVLVDSEADARKMENHSTRPEFERALREHRTGTDTRDSHTVGIEFLYTAVPVPGGAVRLAYPLTEVRERTAIVRRSLLIASLAAFAISAVLAGVFARWTARRLDRIVAFADQIAAGDFSARISESSSDELARVAKALDRSARELEASFAEVQRSREQLEALLNSMQEPVLGVNAERKVQWANGQMSSLFPSGWKQGASLVEVVRDPELLGALQSCLSSRMVTTARAELIKPGRIFKVTCAPIAGSGAVAVLHEITEIEKVEKTRRDFIANVSHELRTPLTSVQGYTETLLELEQKPEAREFLEIIRRNAARMARLTEDLLILARVESGEEEFRLKPVLPNVVLANAVESVRELSSLRGQKLLVENNASQAVLCDLEKIHHVFSNLVDNAMKYSPTGAEVVIGAEDVDHGVQFFVRDQGIGIASEHLPRLFERFYRVDKARSQESGGTGLGLAIAKHIVLKHGGSIRAESELKKGSSIYFVLPAA